MDISASAPTSTAIEEASKPFPISRRYALTVFALIYCMMLSDYMSRQVLNAVFPLLKRMWVMSDSQLGSLSGVVPLMVGILVVPLSALTDRFGRVRGITAMVSVWSIATIACAVSSSYGEMLVARFFVGVGEAAYTAAGVALIMGLFPKQVRATLVGAYSSGVPVGTVSGVALGGFIAERFGWRWSFAIMAAFGLLVLVIFRCICSDKKIEKMRSGVDGFQLTRPARELSKGRLQYSLVSLDSLRLSRLWGTGVRRCVDDCLAPGISEPILWTWRRKKRWPGCFACHL